jgi:hypothetical protein
MQPALFWLSRRSQPKKGKMYKEIKIQEVREIAKGEAIETGKMKKTVLIRYMKKCLPLKFALMVY